MVGTVGTVKKAVALSVVLAAGSTAKAHIIPFFAMLDGPQVVDPTDSLATGAASIRFDHHGYAIEVKLYLEGIGLDDLKEDGPNATPIHIHKAPRGENGPIVIDLGWWTATTMEEYEPGRLFVHWEGVFIGGEQGNVYSEFTENEDALYDGNLYIDVHTNAYPTGEIRGQIFEVPGPGGAALLALGGVAMAGRRRR
ncbi:MAG: CHRD domain-containing protein [Phycisphaerae bacterium]|nr:CHRD domain-containing protein [Phycisphaerae bacterium]